MKIWRTLYVGKSKRTKEGRKKVSTPLKINSLSVEVYHHKWREKVMAQAMRCFEILMRFNHAIIMLNECDLV
jgi:hypothetical protein